MDGRRSGRVGGGRDAQNAGVRRCLGGRQGAGAVAQQRLAAALHPGRLVGVSAGARGEEGAALDGEQIGLGDAVALGVAVDVVGARADGGAGVCARGRPAADDAAARRLPARPPRLPRPLRPRLRRVARGGADAAAARPAARAAEEGARADGAHPQYQRRLRQSAAQAGARARAIRRRAILRRAIRRTSDDAHPTHQVRCAPSTPCRRWW